MQLGDGALRTELPDCRYREASWMRMLIKLLSVIVKFLVSCCWLILSNMINHFLFPYPLSSYDQISIMTR